MSFNLDDYEPVADRLERFWKDHPSGRVLTEMLSRAEGVVVFRASVWFDRTDAEETATGWASEVEGGRGVNATSALENCETSAIGRALANCNYAPKGQRPSREEMTKQEPGEPVTQAQHKRMAVLWRELGFVGEANRDNRLRITAKIIGMEELVTSASLTANQAARVITALEERKRVMDESKGADHAA